MRRECWLVPIAMALAVLPACAPKKPARTAEGPALTRYTEVTLTADLSGLSEKERQMIPLLVEACQAMDAIFWKEAYGDRDSLLASQRDTTLRRFAEINYGPWDRLRDNQPFVPGVGPKPAGAGFYPVDMSKEEFDKALAAERTKGRSFDALQASSLKGLYTIVRRDAKGGLVAVAYHDAFRAEVDTAVARLRAAAALAEDPGLRRYLTLRAQALLTDDYRPSDLAWMDMKDNGVDVVIGPIETYEDKLFAYKATHEGYVLLKDREWSARLARYVKLLPRLQQQLPVPARYKAEKPGSDSDLNAYDALFYAGDCNAGAKTIAINLPNDERIQLEKGTRRLQLKNAMRAKFDKILTPIADRMIVKDQRKNVQFDAFFAQTMLHETAHGLGIKNTVNGRGTVREALKDLAGAVEEGKADVLGLFLAVKLKEMNELGEAGLMDNYVTYLAGLFRSVRFGAADAHGRANLAQFEFFKARGAFSRDSTDGTYRVDAAKMREAIDAYSARVLTMQGDGDYAAVAQFLPGPDAMDPQLRKDLAALASADIPTDIVFQQGLDVLRPALDGR
jgi:hypothetical protein